MRIIFIKIWQRLLAESPKIIVRVNFFIQVLPFMIMMLGKIVYRDLVNLFGSAIIFPFCLVNYIEYKSIKALKTINIILSTTIIAE